MIWYVKSQYDGHWTLSQVQIEHILLLDHKVYQILNEFIYCMLKLETNYFPHLETQLAYLHDWI